MLRGNLGPRPPPVPPRPIGAVTARDVRHMTHTGGIGCHFEKEGAGEAERIVEAWSPGKVCTESSSIFTISPGTHVPQCHIYRVQVTVTLAIRHLGRCQIQIAAKFCNQFFSRVLPPVQSLEGSAYSRNHSQIV